MSAQPSPTSPSSVQPPRLRLIARDGTALPPTPADELPTAEDSLRPAPDLGFLRAIVLGCVLSAPLWMVMMPLLHAR